MPAALAYALRLHARRPGGARGADVRVSTIRKLYAALGCRVVLLPAGALYELDWRQAHNDDAIIESEKEIERLITGGVPEGWEEAPEG